MSNSESMQRAVRDPLFQFFRDLDGVLNSSEIVQVTDRQRIAATSPTGGGVLFDGRTTSEQPALIVCLNDVGQFILNIGGQRRAFDGGREIIPTRSPVMTVELNCLNNDGYLGGAVRSGSVTTGRIWSRSGAEEFVVPNVNTSILAIAERGSVFAVGTWNDDAALFDRIQSKVLRGPAGEKASATIVNSGGISGGFYVKAHGGRSAALWDSHGDPISLGVNVESDSRVIGVLEDLSIVIEVRAAGELSYEFGRPGSIDTFDSTCIGSVEAFPLVSIDAISPTGIMVVTLKEPNSGRKTRALIGPESARRDQSK